MKKAADAIVELQSYGVASTADKFLEQIKQEVAESKAAVEVATGAIDTKTIERERTARKVKAAGILQQFEMEMGISKPTAVPSDEGAERRRPGRREAGLLEQDGVSRRRHLGRVDPPGVDRQPVPGHRGGRRRARVGADVEPGAVPAVARQRAGAVADPRLGAAAPQSARRRREVARAQQSQRRAAAIASFEPQFARRYAEMEQLCQAIEGNYQGLSGISQAYLSEQRGKLDNILDGCLNRILALQRYDRMPMSRNPAEIKREIADLQKELTGGDSTIAPVRPCRKTWN